MDCIDLYLLHWRGEHPLAQTVAGFEAPVARGHIALGGVSNLDIDDKQELAAVGGDAACASNQVHYSLGKRGAGLELRPCLRQSALRSSFDHTGRRWRHADWLSLASALAMGGIGDGLAADGPRPTQSATASQEQTQMWMIIGGTHRFAVALEDNPTARAFAQMLPMTLDMPELNDDEKHLRLDAFTTTRPSAWLCGLLHEVSRANATVCVPR